MIPKRPKDANRKYNANGEDGFLPLWTRVREVTHNNHVVIEHVTAWEPTPDELVDLKAGGVVEVSLLVPQMVGINVYVAKAAEPLETSESDQLIEKTRKCLSEMRDFYDRVCDEQMVNRDFPRDFDTYQHAVESLAAITKIRETFQKEFG